MVLVAEATFGFFGVAVGHCFGQFCVWWCVVFGVGFFWVG
jgi:hypothetical protein